MTNLGPLAARHMDEPFICLICGPVEHDLALQILGEILICHGCIVRTMYLTDDVHLCEECPSTHEVGTW